MREEEVQEASGEVYLEPTERQLARLEAVLESHQLAPYDAVALKAVLKERKRLREALKALLVASPSGDEFRLLLVGVGGTQVAPELHARCDQVTAARDKARELLR